MTPKVKAFLDFVTGYLGTDQDPRAAGCGAYECFEKSTGVKGRPFTPAVLK